MQLPIDPMALINEATNIEEALKTPLSVSVYLDEHAPADLAAHVRNAFASTSPTVRMTISYLDSSFMPHEEDDAAIIVAGTSATIGAAAAAVRAVGVPVMVVSSSPDAVAKVALEKGHAIPQGDLVSPDKEEGEEEPIALNADKAEKLDNRMGRWLVAVCKEKRLAMAIAFPFMRRPLARDAVLTTSLQNGGIGIVPFIPGADLPIMTLNQAKMVLQIAAAYGHEVSGERFKEIGACVGGAFLCRTLSRELIGLVPFLGWLVRPAVAYGGTSALGYAVIEYYEGGENATGVAAVVERAAATGSKAFSFAREKTARYAPVVSEALEKVGVKLGSSPSAAGKGSMS